MGFCLQQLRQILSSATDLHQIRTGSPLSPRTNISKNVNALWSAESFPEFSVSHLLIALTEKLLLSRVLFLTLQLKSLAGTSHFHADGFPGKTVIKQGKSPPPWLASSSDPRDPLNFDNNLSQF